MSSLESPESQRTPWMIASVFGCLVVCLLLSALTLVVIYFTPQANQPIGMLPIAIELVGTSTPYPTHTPYVTATPYFTATPYETSIPFQVPYPKLTAAPYPTVAPYPTTGPLRRLQVSGIFGCELRVKNQYIDRDAVIILSDVDTNRIMEAVYVRARDSFTQGGIRGGTFYTYVALGQDWDDATYRFKSNAAYFRFENSTKFSTCGMYIQGYQYITVTLNADQGTGESIISVPPNGFPSVSPNSF